MRQRRWTRATVNGERLEELVDFIIVNWKRFTHEQRDDKLTRLGGLTLQTERLSNVCRANVTRFSFVEATVIIQGHQDKQATYRNALRSSITGLSLRT